jgi:hypothetical protein
MLNPWKYLGVVDRGSAADAAPSFDLDLEAEAVNE